MRTAVALVTLMLLLLQGQALACQCSTPAPMAGEDRAAYLTRVWSFRLNLPYAQQKHVFIATVDQNMGWSRAMTENGGRWPVVLSGVEVLAGSAPPDGVVQNSNPCGATMAIGTRVLAIADDQFRVGYCTVEPFDVDQDRALRRALTLHEPDDTRR